MSEDGMNNSLFRLLLKNEQERAHQVYLRQPRDGVWHEFTWSETMQQARKVAAFLQKIGLKKGDHVSIVSKNCAEWFITDFGVFLAGMILVPLFPNQNESNNQYVLEHAEAKLVFIGKLDNHKMARSYIPEKYLTANMGYHEGLQTDYTWSEILATEPLLDLEEPNPDDLFTIIYSSGTSGTPKGAMYTNRALSNYLTIFLDDISRLGKLDHYKLISYLPLAHVYERMLQELSSTSYSSDVSFIESPETFAKNIKEIKPSFFTAVPKIWGAFQHKIEQKIHPNRLNFLLKIPFVSSLIKKKIVKNLGLDATLFFVSGAAHLPSSIINFFEKLDIRIIEGYGQTEDLAYCTMSLPNERRYGYVGTPRLKVQVKLSDNSELLVYSPCLMKGYFKEEEATKNSFTEEGWLRTGDIAEIDSKNRVKIVGRLSDKFKNQTGEFVSPATIEKLFANNPVIEQLCLVGKGLPSNVMLVTLNEAVDISDRAEINSLLEEIVNQVNAKLLKHEKVYHVIVAKKPWTIENNMLTPTLKVKRNSIEQYYQDLIQKASHKKNIVEWE